MIRRVSSAVLVTLLLVAVSHSIHAQTKPTFFIGAGPTFPSGDYGTYAKTGWMGTAGVNFSLGGKGLWVGPEFLYGSNSHDDTEGGKTNLLGLDAALGYSVGDSKKVQPYFFGLVGYMNHQFVPTTGDSESEGDLLWGLGAGLSFPVGKIHLFAETRYMARGDTKFIPIFVGLSFGGN